MEILLIFFERKHDNYAREASILHDIASEIGARRAVAESSKAADTPVEAYA